jgi:hypothetical protein
LAGTQVVEVTRLDFRYANQANLPYQRVNTATDYDTAGFPKYLRFDGVDDFMSTAAINFTGTDKMTVWAGIRKPDNNVRIVYETGAIVNTTDGSFALVSSTGSGTSSIASRGTAYLLVTSIGVYSAPVSYIATLISNITAPLLQQRVNGAVDGSSTASQGTGNYGNYPLYIGARAGTSLFFNGHLYGLIARGAQSNLPQITAVEYFTAGKTGITL